MITMPPASWESKTSRFKMEEIRVYAGGTVFREKLGYSDSSKTIKKTLLKVIDPVKLRDAPVLIIRVLQSNSFKKNVINACPINSG